MRLCSAVAFRATTRRRGPPVSADVARYPLRWMRTTACGRPGRLWADVAAPRRLRNGERERGENPDRVVLTWSLTGLRRHRGLGTSFDACGLICAVGVSHGRGAVLCHRVPLVVARSRVRAPVTACPTTSILTSAALLPDASGRLAPWLPRLVTETMTRLRRTSGNPTKPSAPRLDSALGRAYCHRGHARKMLVRDGRGPALARACRGEGTWVDGQESGRGNAWLHGRVSEPWKSDHPAKA